LLSACVCKFPQDTAHRLLCSEKTRQTDKKTGERIQRRVSCFPTVPTAEHHTNSSNKHKKVRKYLINREVR
jgi:hypothetical protein